MPQHVRRTQLTPKIVSRFTPLLRTRGDDFVRKSRVQVVTSTSSLVEAEVADRVKAFVQVRVVAGGALDLQCSCGYSRDHGSCEHLWGVLQFCDRAGTLPSVPDEQFLAEGRSLREAREAAEKARVAREAEERVASQRAQDEATRTMQQAMANAVPRDAHGLAMPATPAHDPRPWVQQLRAVRRLMSPDAELRRDAHTFPAGKRIVYTVDAARSAQRDHGLVIDVGLQVPQKKAGVWGATRTFRLTRAQWLAAPDPLDREIAQLLLGSTTEFDEDLAARPASRFVVSADAIDITLRRMCETGRCRVRRHAESRDELPLEWEGDDPWALRLAIRREGDSDSYGLEGWLERGDERLELHGVDLRTGDGVLIANGRVQRVRDHGAHALTSALAIGTLQGIPHAEAMDLLRELYALPQLPPMELPPELAVDTVEQQPVPRLSLRKTTASAWTPPEFEAAVAFEYDGMRIHADLNAAGIVHEETGRIVRRHRVAESAYTHRLEQVGFRRSDEPGRRSVLRIAESRGVGAAVELVREGWQVEFEGRTLRTAGPLALQVRTGIDWFDVDASVEFGGNTVRLPELLAALRRGERTIRLNDDSLGVLHDDWIDRTGLLAATGAVVEGRLRFAANQLGVLDVLLSALPEPDIDAAFAHAREQLTTFQGVHEADPPASFTGTLRDYQREGLGWLHFLRSFGFGGCLADDMGLGKTVQVLALLAARQTEGAGPSLVVVPRSLVFNWVQEAERFAPTLRLLVHQGPARERDTSHFREYDVVITTYGTLRRDAPVMREMEFDYLVLDEAQAIKNSATASAKAARLVRTKHRIAMSGTPIENSIRELWSLLDFLNPGLLGKASVFAAHLEQLERRDPMVPDLPDADASDGDEPDAAAHETESAETSAAPTDARGNEAVPADGETERVDATMVGAGETSDTREASRALLARAVRPYILRRTKAQVAPELPERLEQTLLVELSTKERARYDELRDHYRTSLFRQIGPGAIGAHRMHVLEALLRLRQAACHPGLIDPSRRDEPSSKVELLVSRVSDAVAEGHKVLVFSQFTTLLGIVRDRFDRDGIAYAYLDGDTTDRQRVVTRFQEDPACPVFLISLKAGGVGLNLTAADYVYLLDPWWNPAVEAQAIDRAHRIGQTRRVFAARLIARDTVEEKVLALQEQKRDLADAIIRADASVLSSLGREELELLLS